MEQLPTVLGALILAAILWVVKATQANTTSIAVLTSSVKEHIIPDLDRLGIRADNARDAAETASGQAERLDERVNQVEIGMNKLWQESHRRSTDPKKATK